VDHTAGGDVSYRTVTVTGNELSVKRAEEMINLIIANPLADASSAVDMLIREKAQGTSEWGSGPPYVTMPNNGFGMPPSNMAVGGTGAGGMVGGYGQHQQQQQQPMQYGSYTGGYGQQLQQQAPPSAQPSYGHYGSTASRGGGSGGLESEIFYSSKSYMGRIIGQKGVTINDLQKRSGCDIQINQNVPMGQDCEVHIKGSRQGIEMAKQMLNEILQMGPNHPYAGGQGGGGSGGGYQQPTGYMQQQAAYGQTQPQYQQHYGQQAQYGTTPNQYGYMQQTQMQQPTPQYGAPYGSGQAYGYVQQPQTQLAYQQPAVPAAYSPWKTATSPDGQIYYYNEKTNETTWDKPAGMP
jgi:rRNA processing protein Krr1/Pno1